MFHRHSWEEVGRSFSPSPGVGKISNVHNSDILERFIYGFTNIEMQCSSCGDKKVVTAVGDVR